MLTLNNEHYQTLKRVQQFFGKSPVGSKMENSHHLGAVHSFLE